VALVCNIDRAGRIHRLRVGLVLSGLGLLVALLSLLMTSGGRWPWVLGALLLAGGLFSLFEAWRGWCVARAMGFKTRV
jgi:hypothetical protein